MTKNCYNQGDVFHTVSFPELFMLIPYLLISAVKNIIEKRALTIMEINTRIPKSLFGGKLEKARTKNPNPTTSVLKRIGVPLFLITVLRVVLRFPPYGCRESRK